MKFVEPLAGQHNRSSNQPPPGRSSVSSGRKRPRRVPAPEALQSAENTMEDNPDGKHILSVCMHGILT